MAGKNMEVFPEIWKASDSKQKFGNISKHVESDNRQGEVKGLTEVKHEVELKSHEQVKIKNKLK